MEGNTRGAVPIKKDLWSENEKGLFLNGSQCSNCLEVFFPKKENNFCPQCQSKGLLPIQLGSEGTILTYTIVHQQPAGGFYKGPVPFAYGIIQLPEGVNIYSLITDCNWEHIRVGQKARLVVEKLYEQEDVEVLTYKFDPVF